LAAVKKIKELFIFIKAGCLVTLRPNERSIEYLFSNNVEDIGDKKQAIFESTLELIREHGFHGAPMSLVAKNAGVAAGTIYHYFESKDHLIVALYEYNRDRVTSVIESAFAKENTYRENFFSIWTGLYRFYVQEPNVLIFFEQFVNSPFKVDKYPDYTRGKFYSFFAEGVRKGILKPVKPEFLLVLVMGSINSIAKMQVFGKVAPTKNDLHRIAEILWQGIAATDIGTKHHLK
jgi:AcrR family transcriptional regulator